ncbi:MAG: hypothetical protein K2P48_08120 [Lachnospiraceae bacterium]|nr:hypothetical protein [Lachnospiraceae bacterium]
MKKQIEGQINLFDYISAEDIEVDDKHDTIEISLFMECASCWCSTRRHNAEGKAVPRDFAGVKKPCPSCSFCVSQDKAEICEINSYENGCKLRAEEEGISERQ